MGKEEYVAKLFQQLDMALMDEAKAKGKTRRIILEIRKIVSKK